MPQETGYTRGRQPGHDDYAPGDEDGARVLFLSKEL
jgi:hypothetical protein